MSNPLFPSEFDPNLLELGERTAHNERGDWSAELTYDDCPVQIQTPWLRCVFGTSSYTNSNKRVSYSLSFELSKEPAEVEEFHAFLRQLDEWFQKKFGEMKLEGDYFSSIRPSSKPHLAPTLRTKLKTKGGNFDLMYMDGNNATPWPVGDERVQHGDKCRSILQLMPVWSAAGRIGTSWKVVTIQKMSPPTFRKVANEHPTFV